MKEKNDSGSELARVEEFRPRDLGATMTRAARVRLAVEVVWQKRAAGLAAPAAVVEPRGQPAARRLAIRTTLRARST